MDERPLLIAIALCAALAVLAGLERTDEVNLLTPSIADAILDAAAQGRYTVRRAHVAGTYQVKFVLIGSMNPEEGTLRRQAQAFVEGDSTEGADDTSNNNRHDPHLLDTSRLSRADQSRRTRAPSPVIREAA